MSIDPKSEDFNIFEVLGFNTGPIEISGTYEKEYIDYIYFQDNEEKTFTQQFDELFSTMSKDPYCKNDATMRNQNTIIITPDNIFFHCLSISGDDTKNWVKGFYRAAKKLDIIGAEITGPIYKELGPNPEDYVNIESYKETGKVFDFVRSDGKSYKLSDCEIYEAYCSERYEYEEKIKKYRQMLQERINKD